MVEFLAEGQQPQSRQGAEPQRQDACNESTPVSERSKFGLENGEVCCCLRDCWVWGLTSGKAAGRRVGF